MVIEGATGLVQLEGPGVGKVATPAATVCSGGAAERIGFVEGRSVAAHQLRRHEPVFGVRDDASRGGSNGRSSRSPSLPRTS